MTSAMEQPQPSPTDRERADQALAAILDVENAALRSDLEKTQAALAAKEKPVPGPVVCSNHTWRQGYCTTTQKLVQRIEAAADKFGITRQSISWDSNSVALKMAGPARDVAKLEEWIKYWQESSKNNEVP